MVDKITVTVHTELTQYGEVVFSVKSHAGIFKRKCLHDALSDADIKMTGIEDVIKSFRRRLKNVEHFAIESNHIRLHEENRETEERSGESSINIEPAPKHSTVNISCKRRKSIKSNARRKEAVLL